MKVGHGIFGWESYERRSCRYGAIHLADRPYEGDDRANVIHDKKALHELAGRRVRITCTVVVARTSSHVGDKHLRIRPSRPAVGEVVDLGVGRLRLAEGYDGSPDILLEPEDGREELWMDPHKFYRLHDQTVDVFAEETKEQCSPKPAVEVPPDGAIENEDGSLQVKTKASSVFIRPKVEDVDDMAYTFKVVPPGNGGANAHFNVESAPAPSYVQLDGRGAAKVSDTQRRILDEMRKPIACGQIHRTRDGFWTTIGTPLRDDGVPIWWVSLPSLRAMERRGWLRRRNERAEWSDSRELTEAGRALVWN